MSYLIDVWTKPRMQLTVLDEIAIGLMIVVAIVILAGVAHLGFEHGKSRAKK